MISRKLGEAPALGVLNSRISAPEQNARPPPARTIAFTAGSAAARARCSMTAWRMPCASVFIGGLSKRITAVAPWTVYSAPLMRPPSSDRLSEIGRAHLRVGEQRARGSRQNDGPALHDVGAARELERRERVLLDEQNRHAIRRDIPYRREHGLRRHGREPHARLVEQQQL